MESPRVSVIIPHYHDLAALDRCLSALARQTYPVEALEIIVADNGSPEGEAAVAARIAGRAQLVIVHERGAGPARNGGVAAAKGDILAFTDSDCVPAPEWVAEGVAALARADFVGGAVNVLVSDTRRMTSAEAFESVFAFDNEAYVTRKGFTVTANLFCSRALFESVGGFRVDVAEDLEWSHRARAAGYRIAYAPSAVVGHPARRTWPDLQAKWRRLNSEAYALHRSRGMGRGRWLLRCLALPASAIVHSAKALASPRLTGFGARLGAMATLYRLRTWRMFDGLGLLASRRS